MSSAVSLPNYTFTGQENPSLRSRGFMRSEPQALLTPSLSKTSLTSCTVKGSNSICSWGTVVFVGRDLLLPLTTDCDAKYLFNIEAFSMSVSAISLLYIRVGTDWVLLLTFRIYLDVFQNSFE